MHSCRDQSLLTKEYKAKCYLMCNLPCHFSAMQNGNKQPLESRRKIYGGQLDDVRLQDCSSRIAAA